MKVRIIGADSIGVRSMATIVEVHDHRIFIDPGVSFAPRRYGLPPHPLETERLEEIHNRIVDEMRDVDIVIITHYHYDHYLYSDEDIGLYRGKKLYIKDPIRYINRSQRMRAYRLLVRNEVRNMAEIEYLDSKRVELSDGTVIEASPPMPHGREGSKLGYLIMVSITFRDEVFIHASDVQGPVSKQALEWIVSKRPSLIYISGPPTYFKGYKVPKEDVEEGLKNLEMLASRTNALVIADHHFARDLDYLHYLNSYRSRSLNITSAAEFMGVKYEPLEALRKELWSATATHSHRAFRNNAG